MSSSSSDVARQDRRPRQAATVERLLEAGLVLLAEDGGDTLTVRRVATRAGVSSATAYTYFASKSHLVAELFARMLAADAETHAPAGSDPLARVQAVTRHLTDLLEDQPALAAATTAALLGRDPDVDRLRLRIGGELVARFEQALGDRATPEVVETLTLAFSGALLQAGMGLVSYAELGDRLDRVVATILAGVVVEAPGEAR